MAASPVVSGRGSPSLSGRGSPAFSDRLDISRSGSRKDEKALLARKLVWLLAETPDGVCGGLLTQKLKTNHMDLIERVYKHGGEIQRGWLQDLTRKIPEVEKAPMGRDTWYKCTAAHLQEAADSPSRCTSGSSSLGSPGMGERSMPVTPERIVMETPARTDLANAVQSLLMEAPGGMSGSALGLRLRRQDRESVEAFYEEGEPGEPKPAILDLVKSMPGVIISTKGGSEFYSMQQVFAMQKVEAFSSLLDPCSPPDSRHNQSPPRLAECKEELEQYPSPLETIMQQIEGLIGRLCSRRKKA